MPLCAGKPPVQIATDFFPVDIIGFPLERGNGDFHRTGLMHLTL